MMKKNESQIAAGRSEMIGLPANYPILFLYQNNGYYYYLSHCCNFEDPHSGLIVSPFPLAEVLCNPDLPDPPFENPGESVSTGRHGSSFNGPIGTGEIEDVEDHSDLKMRRREFFVYANDKVAVTDLIEYNKFSIATSRNNEPKRLIDPVKGLYKVYSLKLVQVTYKLLLCNCHGNARGGHADGTPHGNQDTADTDNRTKVIDINLKFLIADCCRFQTDQSSLKLNASEIFGTDTANNRKNNLFILKLEDAILGIDNVFVLTKNLR